MRNVIGSAMVTTMALSLFWAVMLFGAVGMDLAAPAFLLGFLATALWGIKLLTARKVSWKQAPTHWPVAAFLIYAGVRYLFAPVEYDARLEFIQIVFYALIYFVAANNLYHSRDRVVLIAITALIAVFQAGYGLWQAASNSDMVFMLQRPESYNGRGSGSYICPNHLAGFLEMALGLLVARAAFFHGKRGTSEKNVVRKLLLVYAALMALAGIVSTFSRAGWVATAAALLTLVLWSESRIRATWQRVALGSATILVVVAAMFVLPKVWSSVQRMFLPEQTAGGRTLMWLGTVRMIGESPVWGTGPASWQWYHQLHRHPDLQIHPVYAHSDTLQLVAEYGLVGWGLAVAFFACFFWQVALLTTRKTPSDQRSMAIGGSIAVIAILVHSWADFNLHIPANALFMVLIIGMVAAMEDPHNRYRRVQLGVGWKTALGLLLLLASLGGSWFTIKGALSAWHTNRGNDAKEIIAWERATTSYAKAIQADPVHPAPYAQLADVLRTQSIWRIGEEKEAERQELARQAVQLYQASLDRNPFQSQVWVRLANAHELLEQPDQALAALERALEVDPKSAFVYLRLGQFYRKQGDLAKAAQAFETSEKLNASGDEISRLNLEEIRPRR